MNQFKHELHYITPLVNVKSILELGILSHELANDVEHDSIALEDVQSLREHKSFKNGLKLHQYANVYIDARNPMMYKRKAQYMDICVLCISLDILTTGGIIISNMNASRNNAKFYCYAKAIDNLEFDKIYSDSWYSKDYNEAYNLKGIKCAEVLIPYKVNPEYITKIIVSTDEVKEKVTQYEFPIPIEVNEELYFNPEGYDFDKLPKIFS